MANLVVRRDGRELVFTAGEVTVGRSRECDVVVATREVSRRHLRFVLTSGTWMLINVSANGTFVAGAHVAALAVPSEPIDIALGDPERVDLLVWQDGAAGPDHASRTEAIPPGLMADGETVLGPLARGRKATIGRAGSNTVVLDDPLVSRLHAEITFTPTPVLRDLGSFNGTFVNGVAITGDTPLVSRDRVSFGVQTFVWRGDELVAVADRSHLTLHARELTRVTSAGLRLLDSVSFRVEASSLTAVIGPSGAGKSTLLAALTGITPADSGSVVWQGRDLYDDYDQLRLQIGLVPQQDTLHMQLRVRQALGYSAELRLPPDTGAEERATRVALVADQLHLGERLDNRIGTELSGGQRKRVSIASELLTAPPLLFLDEPTSGLDPGLDLEVMMQLRSLSDAGHLVMVVTHSVLALDVCDAVIVMAPGGRVAYHGPPADLLGHFGSSTYPEVFRALELGPPVSIPPRIVDDRSDIEHQGARVVAPARRSRRGQFATLVRRNLAVVRSDRLLLSLLVLMPLLLGGLSRLVLGSQGLSLEGLVRAGDPTAGDEARQRLTVLLIAAALMGSAIAIRELVGERAIFSRERAVGLSPSVYFLSKATVLGALSFVQGVAVTILATVGLPGVDNGGSLGLGTAEVAVVVGALSLVMTVTALCVSAVVTTSEQTMPALVALVMVQLVLSGALIDIAGRPVLDQMSWLTAARWANAAMSSSVGLEQCAAPGREDWFSSTGAMFWAFDLAALTLHLLIVLGLGCRLMRTRGRRG